MRHVSRTHRVAVDWVFDIFNLDSKIQTRDIDTKHQLADIFTKGCFTSDESKNLLHVMEDAPKLSKIPKSECPDIWIRLPKHKWTKSWFSMEDPVVLLERNFYDHPLAGLVCNDSWRKFCWNTVVAV